MDWSPFWLSLRVASCATILSILIGLPIAMLLARVRLPAHALWEGVANLPLVLPPTVLGYAILVELGRRSLPGKLYEHITGQPLVFTWQGAVVATCIASLPLFIGNARVALAGIDGDIVGAARTDGASGWTIFLRILLPLARPGLIAGTTLAFARALGDFGATLMVAGDTPHETQTMPLAIYDALQNGDMETVKLFVVLSTAICLVVCIAAARLSRHH